MSKEEGEDRREAREKCFQTQTRVSDCAKQRKKEETSDKLQMLSSSSE